MYVEEIPLVTKKSSRSGILFPSVGQLVFQLIEMSSFSLRLPMIIDCLLLLNVSPIECVCCCNRVSLYILALAFDRMFKNVLFLIVSGWAVDGCGGYLIWKSFHFY